MTDDEREERQQQFRNVINRNIEGVIRESMGFGVNSKEPFRRKVTFQKLIDYKFERETEEQKFQRFVTMADNIVENVRLMFPFINLDGIDLTWTCEELQNKIYEIFEQTPEMNLVNCPRLSEEERKIIRKKKSALQRELEGKLEAEFRRAFCIPEGEKLARRNSIRDFIEKYVPKGQRAAAEQYIKEDWDRTNNYNSWQSRRIPSEFEKDLKKVFPEVKDFSISYWTKFMDLMRTIKVTYKVD